MTDKQHNATLGAFILGALLVGFAALIFLLGSGFGRDSETVVMVFEGSVKGLSVGAPVALRGVQIGQVTDIEAVLDEHSVDLLMLVEAQIESEHVQRLRDNDRDLTEELIARGLRAQLNLQSLLTGLLYVQLDFHPDSELILADIETPHIQIPTIPTDLERITNQLQNIDFVQLSNDLESTAAGLNKVVNGQEFQALPAHLLAAVDALGTASERLDEQLNSSGPRLDRVLDSTTAVMDSAGSELPELASGLRASLTSLDAATAAFRDAMEGVDEAVAPNSVTSYQLNKALHEIAQAGQALQQLARSLEEQPEALIRGRSNN